MPSASPPAPSRVRGFLRPRSERRGRAAFPRLVVPPPLRVSSSPPLAQTAFPPLPRAFVARVAWRARDAVAAELGEAAALVQVGKPPRSGTAARPIDVVEHSVWRDPHVMASRPLPTATATATTTTRPAADGDDDPTAREAAVTLATSELAHCCTALAQCLGLDQVPHSVRGARATKRRHPRSPPFRPPRATRAAARSLPFARLLSRSSLSRHHRRVRRQTIAGRARRRRFHRAAARERGAADSKRP